jgi:hypothetical protein
MLPAPTERPAIVYEITEGDEMLTNDWTDDDLAAYVAFCASIGVDDLTVPITVWANESDNRTTAHNPNGDASGLCQMMPQTMRGLGYIGDSNLADFRTLDVTGQLAWCQKYYAAHAGQIGTIARFYLATFLPALLSHGDDLAYVLCGQPGPMSWAYYANQGFDREHKGTITVGDLVRAANAAVGPRTRELISRVLNGTETAA